MIVATVGQKQLNSAFGMAIWRRLQYRLAWLFLLTVVAVFSAVAFRNVVGFGWPATLDMQMSFSSVKCETTLKCVVFSSGPHDPVCIAIEEIAHQSGVPIQSRLPNWVSTNKRRTRIFVLGREVVRCEGLVDVFCQDRSGRIFVRAFGQRDLINFDKLVSQIDDRELFNIVLRDGVECGSFK